MRALCRHGKNNVQVETVPCPKIEDALKGDEIFKEKHDNCIKVVLKP